ncbi:hypothetical protein QJS04_geneDACA011305 [Acorus gramineus]|uniref:Cyclin-dependent protein kinase inhibitor SMR4 n=1 Tax=Acorus gramineus TaxID=55184 RepID=A0AAV9AKA9_ACOGR|nr:hypothetical protein QJS04_geneDACA011305 [Acorus gramineus]
MESDSETSSYGSVGGGDGGGWETPKRRESRIPAAGECPPAPPRKRSTVFGRRRAPPKNGYFQPPDLEAFFKLVPRREACA